MLNVNLNASHQTTQNSHLSSHWQLKQTASSRADINISIDQQPLKLLYQAAIDRINEQVAPYLGDQAIQRGYQSGVDVSPEATANRIVSMTTALFGLFRQQHPQQDLEQVATKFAEVITLGIKQGFADAREILSGLGVLEGDIGMNIDLTFDLVMDGIAAFVEKQTGDQTASAQTALSG